MSLRNDRFGKRQRQRKKDGVTGRHVGNRNRVTDLVDRSAFGNRDRRIGECRPAKLGQVDIDDSMRGRAQLPPHLRGSLQFVLMALAVAKADRVRLETLPRSQWPDRSHYPVHRRAGRRLVSFPTYPITTWFASESIERVTYPLAASHDEQRFTSLLPKLASNRRSVVRPVSISRNIGLDHIRVRRQSWHPDYRDDARPPPPA